MRRLLLVPLLATLSLLPSCAAAPGAEVPATGLFHDPRPVTLLGYDGEAMEPFVTRDGRYLLFNNRNDPSVDTNLHVAERVDDLTFRYLGPLAGANTPALDGVATLDRDGTLYFVSPRSYPETFSTLYRGRFSDGEVSDVELLPGVSREEPGIVNFDVEVSPDGGMLYFVDARFGRGPLPKTADLVIAERTGDGFRRSPDSRRILANVNTDALEYAACISADGRTLLFTRARLGPAAGSESSWRSGDAWASRSAPRGASRSSRASSRRRRSLRTSARSTSTRRWPAGSSSTGPAADAEDRTATRDERRQSAPDRATRSDDRVRRTPCTPQRGKSEDGARWCAMTPLSSPVRSTGGCGSGPPPSPGRGPGRRWTGVAGGVLGGAALAALARPIEIVTDATSPSAIGASPPPPAAGACPPPPGRPRGRSPAARSGTPRRRSGRPRRWSAARRRAPPPPA